MQNWSAKQEVQCLRDYNSCVVVEVEVMRHLGLLCSHGVQAPVVYQTPDHALYTNAFVRKNPNTTKYAAYNHERNRQIS